MIDLPKVRIGNDKSWYSPNWKPCDRIYYWIYERMISSWSKNTMFNKLRKILVNDGIKTLEYQQIFKNVIGYDNIKLLLYKMITSKHTNSVLLAGPPASSKTIFILELLDHFKGKAYFVDGTTVSGIGIIDYLFDHTDLKFLLTKLTSSIRKIKRVLLNVIETGILSDVKAKRSKSARQTHMHLSIYATSNDISNMLTPLLSRFIKLNFPEYSLETFIEICHKILSRETIQAIVQYVWEHTRDIREAIAIAKIVDSSDEVNSVAHTLRRYSRSEGK
jgi:Holliday junction DNA helicase RuvB